MTDYTIVLTRRYPDREWTLDGNDYSTLTILDGKEKPSQKSLDDAWDDVLLEIAQEKTAKENARNAALSKLGLTAEEAVALFG